MQSVDLGSYKDRIVEIRKYTQSMSVLIAEDYEPLHETLKKLFGALFKSVDSAYDGREALNLYEEKIAQGEEYTLLFSDIEMPYMNGIELVKEIKSFKKNTNIIVFSAHQDSKYLVELINLGVRRFILKPASLSDILDELLLICNDLYSDEEPPNILYLEDEVSYDKELKVLYLNGEEITLTKYEQFIIALLIEKVNLAVSNDDIVNYLYENMIDVNIDNVRKLLYKLRQKLPKDFIAGIHGIGYKIKTKSDKKTT